MVIFEKPGKENTAETVRIALEEATKRSIRHIVAASYRGYTADFLKEAKDLNIVIVRGTYGFNKDEPNSHRMSEEKCRELTDCGMKIVTAAHVLSGAERSLSTVFKGAYPVEIIAHTLRMFGQGTKVCVECAAMAADSGAIPANEYVIAIGGTGEGADTAVILKPAHTLRILETKICEFLCKPGF